MLQEIPITFYKSKLKSILLFLGCLVFVLMALFVNKTNEVWYWAGLIFFGFLTIIFFIQIIFPNSSYWKFTEKGVEIKGLLISTIIPWENINDIKVDTRFINFKDKKKVVLRFHISYNKTNNGKLFSKMMSGFDGGLIESYNSKHEQLLIILNQKGFKQN